jgi:Tfp pilus assembly protein PilX
VSGVRSQARAEDGQTLVLVLSLIMLMSALATVLVAVVLGGTTRTTHTVEQQTAYQAAEAGIDDYTSKLVEDSLYYAHTVHPGEATRKATNGTLVVAGSAWPYDLNWTYPNGKNTWRSLPNGYEYDLEITPPSAATNNAITILSTGRGTRTSPTGRASRRRSGRARCPTTRCSRTRASATDRRRRPTARSTPTAQ